MNVLWIMADQLRWDYLSCYGAGHIDTPNLDRLAAQGVRFDRAYVQSPICGPNRMSFYTGRYVRSHGATRNGFPLPVGQPTLGTTCVTSSLVGKTHMRPDLEGMARLGIDPKSQTGTRIGECGFEVFENYPTGRLGGKNPSSRPARWSFKTSSFKTSPSFRKLN